MERGVHAFNVLVIGIERDHYKKLKTINTELGEVNVLHLEHDEKIKTYLNLHLFSLSFSSCLLSLLNFYGIP